MPKAKVTDGQIIKAIKANPNMSNRAMAIELGLSLSGSTNSRINKLKAAVQINRQPDIQLYDTVTKDGIWYRVIGIDKDGFAVRRTDNNGDTTVVPRGGLPGWKNRLYEARFAAGEDVHRSLAKGKNHS